MRRYLSVIRTSLVALLISCTVSVVAVQALDVPPASTESPVVDQTNTLTDDQKQTLIATINAEKAATSNQIGVLIIPSLQGEALEDYSLKVARAWGIGTKEHNNGVLLLIAKDDRQLRIEVGYGLEGALTDVRSGQIIRNQITPQFKNGAYYEGIKAGLDSIIKAIHGEADPAATSAPVTDVIPWEGILFFAFIGFSWLSAILARSKSWWGGGVVGGVAGLIVGFLFGFVIIGIISMIAFIAIGLILDKLVSANYASRTSRGLSPSWWAGGSSGGSSSGGGGFGGGSFGGGGASGSW